MRILWTVNTLMPEAAKEIGLRSGHAISWVDAMSKRLAAKTDIKIAIACPHDCDKVSIFTVNNILYYVFPCRNCDKVDYWDEIIRDFKPDVIHAYGTEGKHNYLLLKRHQDIPVVVSLQGILNEYRHHMYAGIDFSTMVKFTTLKELITPTGFFSGKRDYEKRSVFERRILSLAKNVEGRSSWDRVSALNINPDLEYYYCPRMIRSPFFEKTWSLENVERHSILVHQATSPIKGLHFVLEAVSKLRAKYPDIKLYIAGTDLLHPQKMSRKIFKNGYQKYLSYLIKKYNLSSNIEYTGFLLAEQLAEQLTKVHAVVIPSSIENAPNSLAEGELVGTPTIATFVGGNMDMLEHNKDGFLYCYNEPNMLAEYITRIFESDELAMQLSQHARKTARLRHDPATLEKTILNIYETLISKNNVFNRKN